MVIKELIVAFITQLLILLGVIYETYTYPGAWFWIAVLGCVGSLAIELIMLKHVLGIDVDTLETTKKFDKLVAILTEYIDSPEAATQFAQQVFYQLEDSEWVYPEDVTNDGKYLAILLGQGDSQKMQQFVLAPVKRVNGEWKFNFPPEVTQVEDLKIITVDITQTETE